jgi:hypothetical protein
MSPGRGEGRNTPCANCGHRYGRHALADCQEMIPIHGGAKSCTCPGWTSVTPPDMCHNGHPFEPGRTVDDAPGESHPDWCNVCGEARVTVTETSPVQ